jgi:hypothetical protein
MDSRPRSQYDKFLDALQLHEEAAKAFEARRFDDAVRLYETLDRLGQLKPDERERLRIARQQLQHLGDELEDGQRFLARHQRDRDDEDDRTNRFKRLPRNGK